MASEFLKLLEKPQATATVTITCGCNSKDNPQVFSNILDAIKHSEATGHKMFGTIKVK